MGPLLYNTIQFAAGARLYREAMVRDFIRPFDGCKIVDIGCGTGEYVQHLRQRCARFTYVGIDADEAYITNATRAFNTVSNVRFQACDVASVDVAQLEDADIVIATGVMHHLQDDLVLKMLRLAKQALVPGGRLVTYDPGRFDRMSLFEHFFVKFDRGRHIRSERDYAALVAQVFPQYAVYVRYLTYYRSRNIIFECFTTTSPPADASTWG